jgi:HEAT repeat protein
LKPRASLFISGRAGRAGEAVRSLRSKATKAESSEPLSRPAPIVEIFRGFLRVKRYCVGSNLMLQLVDRMRKIAFQALLVLTLAVRAQDDPATKITFLAGKLADDSFKVRLKAAIMLGRLPDGRSVEPLQRALRDESYLVRAAAARALGNLGYPLAAGAVPALFALVNDEESFVRQEAARALEKLVGPESLPDFVEALKSQRQELRLVAVRVLARQQDDRSREALLVALGDEDEEVQAEVTMFVKGLSVAQMQSWLRQALERREDSAVQIAAACLVEEMKLTPLIPELTALLGRDDVVPAVRQQARQALKSMREHLDVGELLSRLQSDRPAERYQAIELLGVQAGPQAVDALLGLLKSDDPFLLRRVVAALGETREPRVVSALRYLLEKTEDPRLREQINRSLRALEMR